MIKPTLINMAEINKEELANIVGYHEDSEYLKEDRAIIKDKKQYSVRIPAKFAEKANIKKEDKFRFVLIPPNEEETEFTIQATLIKK